MSESGATGYGTWLSGYAFAGPEAQLFVQIVVIILLSRCVGVVLKPLGLPVVVAEMLAGILLGPTALGQIPGFTNAFFPPASVVTLGTLSQLALVMFMLLVGLELDVALMLRKLRTTAVISATSLFCSFGFGSLLAYIFYVTPGYATGASLGVLILFFSICIGMAALPVLARIMTERGILTTPVGVMTITLAATDDVLGWTLLAVFGSIAHSAGGSVDILYNLLLLASHVVVLFVLVRPVVRAIAGYSHSRKRMTNAQFFSLMAVTLLCAYYADAIGISPLIGGFEVGLLVPRNSRLMETIPAALENLVVVLLMPLFFTVSGLNTDFLLINSWQAAGFVVMMVVVAAANKVIGVVTASMAIGQDWRTSLTVGTLTTCQGLVALIVVNVGRRFNVITTEMFAILVLMVLVTTMSTVPLLLLVQRITGPLATVSKEDAAEFAAELGMGGGGHGGEGERDPDAVTIASDAPLPRRQRFIRVLVSSWLAAYDGDMWRARMSAFLRPTTLRTLPPMGGGDDAATPLLDEASPLSPASDYAAMPPPPSTRASSPHAATAARAPPPLLAEIPLMRSTSRLASGGGGVAAVASTNAAPPGPPAP